jgi:hypothetical protein
MRKLSKEYRKFKMVKHWQPANEILLVRDLTNPKNKFGKFFSFLYEKTKKAYKDFPIRKDGTDPFVHPLNLAWDLKKANIDDPVTLSSALLHDYIEEKVDCYQKNNKIAKDEKGLDLLDRFETKVFLELENDLTDYCKDNKLDIKLIKDIIEVLKLLTRHKRHFYYRSISAIYNHKDEKIKEKAIQVKLADRIHNIQSLAPFNELGKIYQAFKNLFILNNTKRFLIDKYGKEVNFDKAIHPTEKLFRKCCKATYDAFLNVCHASLAKNIFEVESMLQLAFRKFVHEKHGLWEVTKVEKKETHPMRLYQGIVKKYDARLHQEWKKFDKMKSDEMKYCKKFFADFDFDDKQIQALIEYKDAHALKEVVSRLLYKRIYIISGFGCSELCSRGQICMKKR